MDALPVDLNNLQADKAGEGFEGTGDTRARADVCSEDLVGIEVAVAVPAGPVPADEALRSYRRLSRGGLAGTVRFFM